MKKVLLLSAFLLVHAATYAQIRFGVTGGLQSSKLRASSSGVSITTNGLFGGYIGGLAEYTVNDNIVLRPEALISFKGGAFRSGSDSYTIALSYLEIPIVGMYKFEVGNGKIVGGLGPYFGFLLGGRDDDESIKVGTDIRGFDAGLRIMGGYELTEKRLGINLFYDAGLANIVPSTSVKFQNNTLGLSLTYFLGDN